jgi:hypothetical protein
MMMSFQKIWYKGKGLLRLYRYMEAINMQFVPYIVGVAGYITWLYLQNFAGMRLQLIIDS